MALKCIRARGRVGRGSEGSAHPRSSLDAQRGGFKGLCCLRKLTLLPGQTTAEMNEKQMLAAVGVRQWA